MPANGNQSFRQSGIALVLSLLILLVLTVIGVAAMNSTIMQERMAGNASTQADVFEKSSEGVSRSLEVFYQEADAFEALDPTNNDIVCGQVFGDTTGTAGFGDESAEAWRFPTDGNWHLASGDGDNPKLEQRMYCCRSWVEDPDAPEGWVENPSKLFALNRATFLGGANDDESLARREIEVRLSEADPKAATCAICAPGAVGSVSGPNSAALRVDGSCGAAVVTETPGDAATFLSGIPDQARGNFDGGITSGDMGSPWNDPVLTAEFVFWAKLGLAPANYIDAAPTYSPSGSNTFGTPLRRNPDGMGGYEIVGNPEITYIDGNAEFSGNDSGAGIMIVRGNLEWDGTPEFEGLLVVLGGGFNVGGGGQGGDPRGTFVVADLDTDVSDDLFGREVLEYPVIIDDNGTTDDGSDDTVLMGRDRLSEEDLPDENNRPVLRADNGREVIFESYTGTDINFQDSTGSPITYSSAGDNNLLLTFADGVESQLSHLGKPARDAFGRPIPDFVNIDNYPEEYGYDPNEWSWDPDVASEKIEWGSSAFSWSGGGNQNFTYDCRALLDVKHELLCEENMEDLPTEVTDDGDVKLDDDWIQNPTYNGICGHHVAQEKYGIDPPALANQRAWHLWEPSCDCLGVSIAADMVVAGWRENLGWRDDAGFQGCSGLPSPEAGGS
ncbi:MAG: PilX N-terminal domain-containing pilus assembly protein [Pirellulaceae bacterium]